MYMVLIIIIIAFMLALYFRSLYERTHIEHRISSPYHPQTNGLDERTNQTLVHSLTMLSSTKEDWDQCIEAALYAYRIWSQNSTRFSPFFLLYNRHPRKAIDHELGTTTEDVPTGMEATSSDAIIEKLMWLPCLLEHPR